MEIEHLIRYTERAVGLKPSAILDETCLRGLYKPSASHGKAHLCDYTGIKDHNFGLQISAMFQHWKGSGGQNNRNDTL
jgi:hypothetical protein